MQKLFLAAMFVSALVISNGFAQLARGAEIPEAAKALHAKLTARMRPSLRAWIDGEVRKLRSNPKATDATVRSDLDLAISNMGILPPEGDIAEMCFVVLMEATGDMDKDLEMITAEAKAANDAKKQRELATRMRSHPTRAGVSTANASARVASNAYLTTEKYQSKGNLDSMGGTGETGTMRRQQIMDRRAKFVEALSNIMKEMSTSQDTLIQNLK